MRKSVLTLLSAGLAFSLVGCGSSASASAAYTAGTYTGTAQGHSSTVSVTAKFSADKIESVDLDLSGETDSIGQAAGDQLQKSILDKQSAEIDSVTGATETSDAVKAAMKQCISQAQGSAAAARKELKDGTYTESAESFGFTGMMKADVTIADNQVTDINVTEETDSLTGQWFQTAKDKLIPRIIESQSLDVDSITGATTSSGAIKNIVAQAIDAAGGDSTEWHTAVAKKTDTVKLDGYDVIVVGLGGSGILSYCAAAQSGAKVFGIEAAAAVGGNSSSTYGPMALNSENLKKEYNNGEDYIDEDEVYKTWMEYVGTDKKADVIKEAVEQSGPALDYYMDNFGFSFDGLKDKGGLLGSFVVPSWTKEWTVYTADQDNTKWYVLGPDHTYQFTNALDQAKAMNEKNDYQTELTAQSLILDSDGNVQGVKAISYDGTSYEIYGKSVILATGGFLGNEDMMKQYLGSTVNSIGDVVNDGTGIRMGQSAGGALYSMGTYPMIHISNVPNIIRNDDLTADQKAVLSALALTTDMPMVTTEGKQWGTEDQSGTTAKGITVGIAYAPGYRYYVLYTQDDMDKIKSSGLSDVQAAAAVNFIGNGGTLPAAGTPVADLDQILTVGEQYKDIIKADSISELATAIGCDEQTLSESLQGKDQTYYAAICQGYAYGTVGGLDVNTDMNVLKEDGTAIPNLFAVGQDSEGVGNIDGKAYTPWGGQAQSWTFVSGRIAGQKAAEAAKN